MVADSPRNPLSTRSVRRATEADVMELGQWNLAHWNFGELWRKGINKGRSEVARWESSNRGRRNNTRSRMVLGSRSPTPSRVTTNPRKTVGPCTALAKVAPRWELNSILLGPNAHEYSGRSAARQAIGQ